MKALVYNGPGKISLEEKTKQVLNAPSDAIIKMVKTVFRILKWVIES
jgi:hypothetical protein